MVAGGDRGDPHCSCRGAMRRRIPSGILSRDRRATTLTTRRMRRSFAPPFRGIPGLREMEEEGGGGGDAASADEVDCPPPYVGRRARPWKLYGAGSTYCADVADLRIRFLTMQLFHAATFRHANCVTLGNQQSPERLFLQDEGWVRGLVPITLGKPETDMPRAVKNDQLKTRSNAPPTNDRSPGGPWRSIFRRNNHLSEGELTILPYPGYGDVPTVQWRRGQLTNLCYLMMLNSAAGRTVGDPFVMPILPWVTDFSTEIDLGSELEFEIGTSKTSPWRDLSRSKFR